MRPIRSLIDRKMPWLDGVGAVEQIRATYTGARIVILTTYDVDDVERALRAGARAYLLRDMQPSELLARVRAVDQGRSWVPPAGAARLAERRTR